MAKYIIDTDTGTCTAYKETASTASAADTMIKILQDNRGTKEYNGIVADIQKWFYGSLVKAPWCATCICYLLNKVNIVVRAENVNELRKILSADHYNGTYFPKSFIPKRIEKGDILFWLWSGDEMTNESNKHVGIAEYDTIDDTVFCIGGNQKDSICTQKYNRKQLYAIYRLRR